jgi:lambda family phage portal protein
VSNPNRARDTATLVAGVEKDANGAPLRYHVQTTHPGAQRAEQKWTSVPAFGARTGRRVTLHLFRTLRDGQTRGVPDLAPVMEVLKQLDRYVDAEVDRAVKSALFLAFITSEEGDAFGGLSAADRSEYYNSYTPRGSLAQSIGLDRSSVVGLYPTDSIQFADPKAPNPASETFLATFSTLIGAALELPQEVLMRHFASSYSAARGALLMAWQMFLGRRAWLARTLCAPVYEAVLVDAIGAGRLAAPGFFTDPLARQAWLGSDWVGDAPGHIDENKAVTAAVDRIEAGLSTAKRETAALTGLDYDKVRRQREKERRESSAAAAPRQPAPSADDLDRLDREESYARRS